MTFTFLDTDILIRLANRHTATMDAAEALAGEGELATTSVNIAEFLRGFPAGMAGKALVRIEGLAEIPFGPRAARRFGSLMHALDRAGAPLHAADGLVAAVVLEEGGRLWSGNRRHFSRIPGLDLVET